MSIAIVRLEPSNARLGAYNGLSELGQAAKLANPQLWLALGSAAVGALASWLATEQWTVGEYNYWMNTANTSIEEWDKIGWSSGCWAKYPEARTKWLAFWKRFSMHYKNHGQISEYSYVSDSEEKPARELFKTLGEWEAWFRTNCATAASGSQPGATGPAAAPVPEEPTDWTAIAKYAAYAVGGIVLLSLVNTIRGAITK